MHTPTFEEATHMATDNVYKMLPIATEIYADTITPVQLLRILRGLSDHCFLLESAEDKERWGRYTFLGFDPKLEITCQNDTATVRTKAKEDVYTDAPETVISSILEQYTSPRINDMPPFTGGLVGYFSYEYLKYSEPTLSLKSGDDTSFYDVDLMLFDQVIAFDHYKQKIVLIVNVSTHNLKESYAKGVERLEYLKKLIFEKHPFRENPAQMHSPFNALFDKDSFCEMVEAGKRHIAEGELFQLVLSNRWEADFEGSLLDAYRILRTRNPSPYMFYMGGQDIEVIGASPETLVKLENGTLYTFPLAGTRPRGKTQEEDLALEKGLLEDTKELSEHNMLVDLGRNDLGKISQFGSVCVEKYLSILRFSHVMHIGSTVSSRIAENKTALDAISAVLPAGTLSGAPKIRAMQVIEELEGTRRGIYGGAIGYLDFTGNMDTCIAIRLAYKKQGKVFVRAGAGIVADSNPISEYNECQNKARAVLNAIQESEGGIDR